MAPWQTLKRKIAGARNYSAAELMLVPVCLALLAISRLAMAVLPFGALLALAGRRAGTVDAASSPPGTDSRQDRLARCVGRALRATASLVPWRADCLPQAIAACLLLRAYRIPYRMTIGLEPGQRTHAATSMHAHAWVEAGRRVITGGPVDPMLRPAVRVLSRRAYHNQM
ncbi:lasso peptide biosynthesis B2 protein [Erythrobacter litoralis]|uniref:Microcin J25-processing protein McjB C-terminal domain-containing protein n=1 Tax=Erythrobacter litoralis (strain HTCC2594) TaxID=314225 RepID=Q2NBY2_ERYLH|nr:lasso peptide biosynthesis B2 protein [Erythrobacter litoralis]ABC62809.1 hypothetical protein ELI_03585 [Erythrobacter litoralis HTCC2594]